MPTNVPWTLLHISHNPHQFPIENKKWVFATKVKETSNQNILKVELPLPAILVKCKELMFKRPAIYTAHQYSESDEPKCTTN